jgi:hypothetical protein
MPMHDWTRVRANRFHHFHQDWMIEIARALNRGLLPDGFLALADQKAGGPIPDVITLSLPNRLDTGPAPGVAVAEAPPRAAVVARSDAAIYAGKATRLSVHHPDGSVVAIIEIVSPGNKDSRHALKTFVRKADGLLRNGIHLLIVDPFPPSPRDPNGIHGLIWERIKDEPFALPPGKPLTVAAYSAGTTLTAYVEPVGVGDPLPDLPIFLTPDRYVSCPLSATYESSWDAYPAALKGPLTAP